MALPKQSFSFSFSFFCDDASSRGSGLRRQAQRAGLRKPEIENRLGRLRKTPSHWTKTLAATERKTKERERKKSLQERGKKIGKSVTRAVIMNDTLFFEK